MLKLHKIVFILSVLLLVTLSGCYTVSERSDKKDTIEIKDEIIIKDSLKLREDCIITGKISNAYTNKPIRGANVVVASNPQGTVTDLYGQFDIMNLSPGTYTLQIFCVGYYEKIIPDIEIKPNRLIKLNIKLVPKKLTE